MIKTRKIELMEKFIDNELTAEDLVDIIVELEQKLLPVNRLLAYKSELKEYIELRLSSYCNGFFSKNYDLNNYHIKNIVCDEDMEKPSVTITVCDSIGNQVSETIYYRPYDILKMLEDWTGRKSTLIDEFK